MKYRGKEGMVPATNKGGERREKTFMFSSNDKADERCREEKNVSSFPLYLVTLTGRENTRNEEAGS